MILLMPTQRFGLDSLMRQMSTSDVTGIMDQLSYGYRRLVHLKMPKLSIQSSFSLVNVLLKMGLVDLFTINSQLPFLTDSQEQVKVDDVLQEAILKVDETGTVAAAVQSVSVVTLSINESPEEVSFIVDQPFLAIIVDRRNRTPLFLGKIVDP